MYGWWRRLEDPRGTQMSARLARQSQGAHASMQALGWYHVEKKLEVEVSHDVVGLIEVCKALEAAEKGVKGRRK